MIGVIQVVLPTFGAVVVVVVDGVLLEAVETDLLAVVAADVVTELVVARPAKVVAVAAVVVLGAHEPGIQDIKRFNATCTSSQPVLLRQLKHNSFLINGRT